MSLSFVAKVNGNMHQEQINKECERVWRSSPKTAIKLFFFVLDKNQGKNDSKAFRKIMLWLWENYRDTFFKNFSLIVGVPNSHTLRQIKSEDMLKEDHQKHEEILDFFLEKGHKETFRQCWTKSSQKALLDAYKLPMYGSWKDIILISNKIPKDKKLMYTTISLLSNQIKEDIKKNYNSQALRELENHPLWMARVKELGIGEQKGEPSPQTKENKHESFVERYKFVDV